MNIIIHFGSFLPGSLNNRNPKELLQQQQGINQKFDESSDSTGKSVVEVFIRYPTGRVISSGNCVYSTSRNVRRLLLLELLDYLLLEARTPSGVTLQAWMSLDPPIYIIHFVDRNVRN